jgi:hypothetical protein
MSNPKYHILFPKMDPNKNSVLLTILKSMFTRVLDEKDRFWVIDRTKKEVNTLKDSLLDENIPFCMYYISPKDKVEVKCISDGKHHITIDLTNKIKLNDQKQFENIYEKLKIELNITKL